MIQGRGPQARKKVTREYWFRIGTVWALLVTVAFLISTVFLLPSYVLLKAHLSAAELEAQTLTDVERDVVNTEVLIKEANFFAGELAGGAEGEDFTIIVEALDTALSSDIELRTFTLVRTEDGVEEMKLSGVAASRDALTLFESTLEADPLFEEASVPISDLVRGSNLPFTMTIMLTPPDYE